MSRQMFFDCENCKRGLHYLCKHGNHSLEECKCISDGEYKEQEEKEMNS